NVAGNRSLRLDLRGTGSNRDAVGALAVLKTNRRELSRESLSGTGFLSQPSRRIHFGLPDSEVPERLTIRWSDGDRQTFEDPPAAGLIRITEGSPEAGVLGPEKSTPLDAPPPTFRPSEGT
ncbi:MAG: hypothetical protein GY953_44685, partial [bacterium]|nr:hypothetical protein [bacterium]